MPKNHPKTLPEDAFYFKAPLSIAPFSDQTGKERFVSGVAYSGDIVTDHGYWSRLVIDLATLAVETPTPLLKGHDHDCVIGMVTDTAIDNALSYSARLFSDIDDDAREIAEKADKGFPWQVSVGIRPNSIEEVPTGNTIELNGKTFSGPLTIFRGGRVREISICALGADPNTNASVLSSRGIANTHFNSNEGDVMTLEEALAKIAALEAENAQLQSRNTELSAAQPDPAKFAPIETLSAVQAELSALRMKDQEREINDLVAPALADGRLLPAQETWARSLGKTNISALQEFLSNAVAIPALKGMQTGGQHQGGLSETATIEELEVAANLGIDVTEMIKLRGKV